jgi:sugar phosphate permease
MSAVKTDRIRWRLPVVLLISVVIAYFDRLNISLALPYIAKEYAWTVEETGKYGGILLSIFFVGYGLANIFLSPAAEKYGPRRSLVLAVVCFSIFTVAGAVVGQIFTAFLITRLLLGFGEGIHFPMNSKLTKNWFPVHERSRANGTWVSGLLFATILAPILLVPVIERYGWRAMFVGLGVLGVVVTIPLLRCFCYDTPREHPAITQAEIEYIERGMEPEEPEAEGFWNQVKPFLRNKAFWLAMLGGICNNTASFGLMMWFPTYFVEGRGLQFGNLMYALSIPYIAGVIGIAFMSWLGDRTHRRALVAGIGYILTGIVAYAAAKAPAVEMTIALFSIAIFLQMSFTAQEFAILQRILPRNRVGTGTGFYNGMTMLVGGGLGPFIVGGVVAVTGDYTSGILAVLGAAFLAGIDMLVLSRFLKY